MTLASNNPYTASHAQSTPHAQDFGAGAEPAEPPPAYGAAVGGAASHPATLEVPSSPRRASSDYTASEDEHDDDGISPDIRRSMEADQRELPKGWSRSAQPARSTGVDMVRTSANNTFSWFSSRREFDGASQHIFYVDTLANPPRAIWVHPYDDPEYISSLPKDHPLRAQENSGHDAIEARERAQAQAQAGGESSSSRAHTGAFSSSGQHSQQKPEERTFGRKLKDKLTGSTHDERVAQRKQQAEDEKKAYQQYIMRRKALIDAQRSGQYQQRYSAPSSAYSYGPTYGGRYGGGGLMGAPYGGDIYRTDPYGRRGYGGYGRGYGGNGIGMGGGMGMGMGAGLLGGLLVGDMLF